jgi:hypothetical protein
VKDVFSVSVGRKTGLGGVVLVLYQLIYWLEFSLFCGTFLQDALKWCMGLRNLDASRKPMLHCPFCLRFPGASV